MFGYSLDQTTLIIYVMTFVAVVSAIYSFYQAFVEAAKASAERLDANRTANMSTDEFGSPISRFVTPGRLLQLQLLFALIPAAVAFGALILSGVRALGALVTVPILFIALGSLVPRLWYGMRVKKRQALFENDILDLTVGLDNALRAGMALPQALEKVSSQMHGPMSEELAVVQREYRLGVDLVQALDRLHRRMPCEDMKLLVSAIKLTTEAGGSLAAVLGEMTQMIRGRRQFADKVKALTAEGRFEALAMSCAPLVAFTFLHLIQPELMRPLYTTGPGWITLGVVAALVITGYLVIRKIVSIEV